jgi:integrase
MKEVMVNRSDLVGDDLTDHAGFSDGDGARQTDNMKLVAAFYLAELKSEGSRRTAASALDTLAVLLGYESPYDIRWDKVTVDAVRLVFILLETDEKDFDAPIATSRDGAPIPRVPVFLRKRAKLLLQLQKERRLKRYQAMREASKRKTRKAADASRDVATAKPEIWKGKSANTLNLYLSIIKGVCKEAHARYFMSTDQYVRIKGLKGARSERVRPPVRIKTEDQAGLISECVGDGRPAGVRDAAIMVMTLGMGMRRDEVRNLRMNNILSGIDDSEEIHIRFVGKRKKTRDLYVPAECKDIFRAWIDVRGREAGPVFLPITAQGKVIFRTDEHGEVKHLSDNAVYRVVKRRAAQLGLKKELAPHDLRRAFATRMLEKTGELSLVASLLGHSSLNTTRGYDQTEADRAKKAMMEAGTAWRDKLED